MKKQLQLMAVLLMLSSSVFSQVNVSGGSSATYSTVNAAFAAINAGTHFGAITIDITANTTEPSTPTPLVASGQGAANYTSIVLRPTVTATISGVMLTGRGVLELDGADNVTIDGDIIGGPVNRDLTISNDAANNIAATAAIRLIGRATLGLGATSNTIANCFILGNTQGNDGISGSTVINSYGIYAGNNAVNLTAGGIGDNYDNLVIKNNEFNRAYYGLYIGGTTTGTADNNNIEGNIFGSVTSGLTLTFKGVLLTSVTTSTVQQNNVFNLKLNTSTNPAAIEITGAASSSITISRNKISGVWSTSNGGWGAYGINLTGGNNHTCVNNVIYDIVTTNYSATSTTYNAFGIRITSGTGIKIYYNSVNLYGAYTYSATTCASSPFLVTSTAVTGLDIRNNIFANKMTSNAGTKKFFAVWFPSAYNFLNATLNNNAYMVTNDPEHYVGKIGITTGTGEYSTLGTWQAVSQVNNPTNDNASVPASNANAPFIADNNLDIAMNTVTGIESGAVLIPSLGTNIDYNASVRPMAGTNPNTNPDMGAYEFDGLAGVANDAGVQALVSPAIGGCYGASESIVVTIKNYGTSVISNIPVTVTVSGVVSQTNTGTYTGTLAPSATVNFTVGTLNMLTAGVYTFNASSSLAGDLNVSNDFMTQTTRIVVAPVPLPQTVSFTGFTGANLPTMFPNWYEGNTATVPTGTTSLWTSQTGLNGAGNITARLNMFTTTRNEWIVGPKISPTSATQISFDAAVTNFASTTVGDVMGSDDMVRVMVSTDCGLSYTAIYTVSATNSLTTNFTNFTVPLGAYAGQDIIVAFLAQDGPIDDLEDYDFHLDNINLYNASATDAGVSTLAAPTSTSCYTTAEDVVVDIKNYGIGVISNVPVTVSIAGPITQTVSGTYLGTIAIGATVTFTVGTANLSASGIYTFSSVTSLAGDANTFNDANTATRTVTPMFSVALTQTICSGNSATITATGSASSYSWSTGATTNSIVVSPTTTTIYTVTGNTAACSLVISSTVAVNNPTITGTGDLYCGASGTGTLTANGFSTINWYASPTSTVSLATGNTYVPPVSPTSVTYYAEAASSATGSLQTLFSGGNGCGGGNMFDITATSGGIQLDSIEVNTSVAMSSTFAVIVYYKTGTYVGNETTASAWTPWDTITVVSAGASNPSKAVLNPPLFIPGSTLHGLYINYAANYTNGTNAYTNADLTLQMGAGLCSQFGGVNAGRMFNGNLYYTKPGCTSPRIPVTLTVSPSPTINAVSNPTVLCAGRTATLTATGAATFSWTSIGSGSSVTVSPVSNTVYTVTGTNAAGCSDVTTLSLTVNPSPTVSAVSSASILCVGQTASLSASGANTYTWSTTATGSVIAVSPTVTTNYTVVGTNSFGCRDNVIITQSVSACTGVTLNSGANNAINVYPNPVTFTVEIAIPSLSENTSFELFDVTGKKVFVKELNDNTTTIDLSELAKGMYIYRINDKSGLIKQSKLIKQ